MQIKLSELNTHLEQRDFFKDIFAMDRIADNAFISSQDERKNIFQEK